MRARWIVAGLMAQVCVGCGDDGPAELSFGEASFDFGTLIAGMTAPEDDFCLTNVGGSASEALTITGGAGFAIVADACSTRRLGAGESCALSVRAEAQGNGPKTGELGVNAGLVTLPLNVWVLQGEDLAGSPATMDFGRMVDGSQRPPMPGTIANDGRDRTDQVLLAFDGQDVTEFELVDDLCSGRTLAPGADCSFGVRMRASAASPGRKRATLVASALGSGAAAITVMGVVGPADGSRLPCE